MAVRSLEGLGGVVFAWMGSGSTVRLGEAVRASLSLTCLVSELTRGNGEKYKLQSLSLDFWNEDPKRSPVEASVRVCGISQL